MLGAQVLDHRVRMQHITANLRAEAGINVVAAYLRQLAFALFELHLNQSALEQTHRVFAILQLRALGLGSHHDASWLVA